MVLKTLEFGFQPTEVGSRANDLLVTYTVTPLGHALHVFDTLRREGQLASYLRSGVFVPDDFMDEHLADILRETGNRHIAIKSEHIWSLAVDIAMDDALQVSDEISELDEQPVSVAA